MITMISANLVAAFLDGKTTKEETKMLLRAVSASNAVFTTVAAAAAVASCVSYLGRKTKNECKKNLKTDKTDML